MTSSVWRLAHLALAVITFLFLIIASFTGAVLAYDAAQENLQPYRADDINSVTLAEAITQLKKHYPEITEVTVDHNQFVLLEGSDNDGNAVKAYVDPKTGKILGKPAEKSDFINWNLSLHRSLFLKETGRFIIGIVSFLLMLITVSGLVLVIKRQKSFKNFFGKINKDSFNQYYHVVSGRLLLIPILIISLTATYLFLVRFDIIKKEEPKSIAKKNQAETPELALQDFPLFKSTKLKDVQKIEFPFIEDEPDEFFVIKLKDKELTVNQINGSIEKESQLSAAAIYENLSLNLHTGRTNWIWAVVLGLSSVNILLFIWSGFTITLRRSRSKIKNKYKAEDAEIILLVGSENGTTLNFASNVHQQLLSTGQKSFLAELNQYKKFPKAKHLLIFASTYGLGDPPTNATQFLKRLESTPQKQDISYSVIGFGSHAYEEFCAFAKMIDSSLSTKIWAKQLISLHTVDDRSTHEFAEWARAWSSESLLPIASAPSLYAPKTPSLSHFEVINKSEVVEEVTTFTLNLKPTSRQKFKSGDLLAIYPEGNHKERFYSVGKVENSLQLVVKLFENGLGSSYLYNLKKGDKIKARLIKNSDFHIPNKAKQIILIANGTGIASFLGMIDENVKKKDIRLYCGFRKNSELSKSYGTFLSAQQQKGQLEAFQFAYSREENSQYVMHLIEKDAPVFSEMLEKGGIIMICGALKMQQDVEHLLDNICKSKGSSLEFYKNNGQLLTDCY